MTPILALAIILAGAPTQVRPTLDTSIAVPHELDGSPGVWIGEPLMKKILKQREATMLLETENRYLKDDIVLLAGLAERQRLALKQTQGVLARLQGQVSSLTSQRTRWWVWMGVGLGLGVGAGLCIGLVGR